MDITDEKVKEILEDLYQVGKELARTPSTTYERGFDDGMLWYMTTLLDQLKDE